MTTIKKLWTKFYYWLYSCEACRVQYEMHEMHSFFGKRINHVGKLIRRMG